MAAPSRKTRWIRRNLKRRDSAVKLNRRARRAFKLARKAKHHLRSKG